MNRATRKLRENQLTNILRLEIATAVNRTAQPVSYLNGVGVKALPPFAPKKKGEKEVWLPKVWRRPRKPSGEIDVGAKARLVNGSPRETFFRVLALIQERIRHAGNAVIRALWLEEEKPLAPLDPKDPKKRRRLPPKPGERQASGSVAYRTICREFPGGEVSYVPADMTAAMSHRIDQFYSKHRKRTRGKTAVPSIGETWPIWLRPGGWRFARQDGLNLSVNIDGTWWEIGLRFHRKARKQRPDFYVMNVLRKLVPGERLRNALATAAPTATCWVPGTLGLQKSKNKWYALIQYRQPKPATLSVPNALVVHCGLRYFAVAMDLESALARRGGLWIDGTDIADKRAQFRARRRDVQHASKLHRAGKGHRDRARKIQITTKESQYVESWVRRCAARIVDLAQAKRARIFFMDLKDIRKRVEASDIPDYVKPRVHQAPWFKLRTFIEQAAARVGLPVEVYKPYYHTKRCPRCGTIDVAAVNYKKWKLTCQCGYVGHLDRVGCENAFIDLGLADRVQFPGGSAYGEAAKQIREMAVLTGLSREQQGAKVSKNQGSSAVARKVGAWKPKRSKTRAKRGKNTSGHIGVTGRRASGGAANDEETATKKRRDDDGRRAKGSLSLGQR